MPETLYIVTCVLFLLIWIEIRKIRYIVDGKKCDDCIRHDGNVEVKAKIRYSDGTEEYINLKGENEDA